nr:hypothetical protein FFPRI1PSEUD_09900 [Pseudomonas sp. FFPRI_1]
MLADPAIQTFADPAWHVPYPIPSGSDGRTHPVRSLGGSGLLSPVDPRNGRLLGESRVYDLADAGGALKWGFSTVPWVSAGMIQIGPNLPDGIGDVPAPGR